MTRVKVKYWVRWLNEQELSDLHHACRMMAQYPNMAQDEKEIYTNMADMLWAEHVGRCRKTGEALL